MPLFTCFMFSPTARDIMLIAVYPLEYLQMMDWAIWLSEISQLSLFMDGALFVVGESRVWAERVAEAAADP